MTGNAHKTYFTAALPISTNFLGIRQAVFHGGTYDPVVETDLRRAGVEILYVQNPVQYEMDIARSAGGYFYRPENVVWEQPPMTWESFVGRFSRQRRNKLRRRLRKSEALLIDRGSLTFDDYARWYQLYVRGVVGKERGWQILREDSYMEGFDKLFLSDPISKQLVGGAILLCDDECVTLAFGAYDHRYRAYELSVRIIYEALMLSLRRNVRILSCGADMNFYGHHLALGLMEFKSSMGFSPRPEDGTMYLFKIFDGRKFADECFFFSWTGDDRLQGHYFSDNPRPLKLPYGVELVSHSRAALESTGQSL